MCNYVNIYFCTDKHMNRDFLIVLYHFISRFGVTTKLIKLYFYIFISYIFLQLGGRPLHQFVFRSCIPTKYLFTELKENNFQDIY